MKIVVIGIDEFGIDEYCNRLVLDTVAMKTNAPRFYKRDGLIDAVIGFVKPSGSFA
ncbi:hypothetical protein [Sinorhizobium mexicanum]|uniref:hypothetical protein n=1 Tax=Sinorhizobium mexicanum TaxID=375549 RepID=UPI0015E03E94|nr:hypothetical protein [Sinorhizobium mexicanum]MBP1886418.1 hypothetical protein [Sinorhizobium mexicanum]